MKYNFLFLILFVMFLQLTSSAQIQSNSCVDLRYPIYDLTKIDSAKNISYAANKAVPDYYTAEEKNCNSNTGCDYSNASLIYDVYYPSPNVYTYSIPLPAVIMFHGGSFSDCSNKTEIRRECQSFAQRGFVAFNIEYRRGKAPDGTIISPGKALTIYRAVQDGKGAIRSIVKRQMNGGTKYKIDTSKLFIGGPSAGAIISLFVAYCNQKEINDVLPGVSDSAILGAIENNNYYGPSSVRFTIKGVLGMWGGLLGKANTNPNFPNCIRLNDSVAAILFHGEKDNTLPYSIADVEFSTGSSSITSQCGFTYHLTSDSGYDHHYGSEPIYNRLKSLHIPTELYLDSNAGHGLDGNANYGLSTTNKDSVRDYIIARASIFFQAVINKTARNIQKTRFVDEKNNATYCPTFFNSDKEIVSTREAHAFY